MPIRPDSFLVHHSPFFYVAIIITPSTTSFEVGETTWLSGLASGTEDRVSILLYVPGLHPVSKSKGIIRLLGRIKSSLPRNDSIVSQGWLMSWLPRFTPELSGS